jgi:hypothetical protein
MRKSLLSFVAAFVLGGPAYAQFCPGGPGWVFDDVAASDPFCGQITWLALNNITLGCQIINGGHRLYCPIDGVQRSQMAAFLYRLGNQPNSQSLEIGTLTKPEGPFLHNFGYGSYNTFAGVNAGNFTMSGFQNSAFGYEALRFVGAGNNNTAVGTRALRDTLNGAANTAVGSYALSSNNSGANNTASGAFALAFNMTGSGNTVLGMNALRNNSAGSANVAVGMEALGSNGIGHSNVAVGVGALHSNVDGAGNVAIGNGAGNSIVSGSNNVHIANSGVGDELATMRLGGVQLRTFVAGIRGVTTSQNDAVNVVIDSSGQLGTISSSRESKRDIEDMTDASAALKQLRPVTFHYKADNHPAGPRLQYGLIAEEVADVYPGMVTTNGGKAETVMYQYLAPMLLNEYQKQQRAIEAQAREIAELKQAVQTLMARTASDRVGNVR